MQEVVVTPAERTLAIKVISAATQAVWPEMSARRKIGQDHRLVERRVELHIHALAKSMAADIYAKLDELLSEQNQEQTT